MYKFIDNRVYRFEEITTTTGQKVTVLSTVDGVYYDPSTDKFEEILLEVDKLNIKADGIDNAIVTAIVPAVLTEITFYHADTGEFIATAPVDPVTHIATLQVTATTPGVIRIRAGEPAVTRLNEVIIYAD